MWGFFLHISNPTICSNANIHFTFLRRRPRNLQIEKRNTIIRCFNYHYSSRGKFSGTSEQHEPNSDDDTL